MHSTESLAVAELSTGELEAMVGGTLIGEMVGRGVGYAYGLIAKADPFSGSYYGVGA